MNITIFTTHSFPDGLAGTSRILGYCKGLRDNQASVYVLSTCPHTGPYMYGDILPLGETFRYRNAPFQYPEIGKRVPRKIYRMFNDSVSMIRLVLHLCKGETSAVICYGLSSGMEIWTTTLCNIFKIFSLKEESEYPQRRVKVNSNCIRSLLTRFQTVGRYRRYSGILAMTHPLVQYFTDIGINPLRVRLIPHTVILDRFKLSPAFDIPFKGRYIFFMGSLIEEKDGVLSCIDAYELVCQQKEDYHLIIAGDGKKQDQDKLLTRIKASAVNNKIHYIGRVSSYQIPGLLSNAQLLLACRPSSKRADYGFPTKIVEYLASGKPIVTTVHGDLTKYLVDGENAYLADSSNPASLAAKMLEALENVSKCLEVGTNGRKLAHAKFDPQANTKHIIDFIHDLSRIKGYRWSMIDRGHT